MFFRTFINFFSFFAFYIVLLLCATHTHTHSYALASASCWWLVNKLRFLFLFAPHCRVGLACCTFQLSCARDQTLYCCFYCCVGQFVDVNSFIVFYFMAKVHVCVCASFFLIFYFNLFFTVFVTVLMFMPVSVRVRPTFLFSFTKYDIIRRTISWRLQHI